MLLGKVQSASPVAGGTAGKGTSFSALRSSFAVLVGSLVIAGTHWPSINSKLPPGTCVVTGISVGGLDQARPHSAGIRVSRSFGCARSHVPEPCPSPGLARAAATVSQLPCGAHDTLVCCAC